jgi:ankyrin repeat protein
VKLPVAAAVGTGPTMAEYANAQDVLARVQSTLQFAFGDRIIRSIDERGLFDDTPLITTMSWEDVEAARLLLQAGASVGLRGEDGDTALHRAARTNSVELVRTLIDAGASPDIKNDEGQSPLDLAILFGNAEIVRLLADRSGR